MKKATTYVAMLLAAIGLLLSGCSPMAITGRAKVQQDSFGGSKKFAVVSIASAKHFSGEQGFFQQFKSNDSIPGIDTQPVIDQLVPSIREKFAKTGYYTSVPMSTIVGSPQYIELQEDEKVQKIAFFKSELNVAKGYKFFNDPQKLAELAQALEVDGVITVVMNFSVVSMKTTGFIAVASFGKKEYASNATIAVTAYDRNGNILWQDTTIKQAEPGDKKAIVVLDFSDIGGTNFEKMHPSAVLIGEHAVDVIVQRFKDTMEGKSTSMFQKISDDDTKKATEKKI